MSTTTHLKNLKLNVLTEEQYGALTTKQENEFYLTVDGVGDSARAHYYGTALPSANNFAEGDVFLLCTTPSSQTNALTLPRLRVTDALYLNDYFVYGGTDTFTAGSYKGIVMNNDGIVITNNTTNGIKITVDFVPLVDSTQDLGSSSYRWKNVYARDGIITTSDIRSKTDISALDEKSIQFIMDVQPVSYKLKEDLEHTHYGMIAQQVEDVVKNLGIDFGGLIGDEVYGLRYSEFIAPIIKTLQSQQKRIQSLEYQLSHLTNDSR